MEIKLLDGINGQNGRRSAADPDLIERGVVEERVVIVGAVERIVVGPIAVTVDRELPESALDRGYAGRVHGRAGHQGDEFPEITAV